MRFCNYDYGSYGTCEQCGDWPSVDCDNRGLPQAGATDCRAWCGATTGATWAMDGGTPANATECAAVISGYCGPQSTWLVTDFDTACHDWC